MSELPRVAIVGRPNVGKSTLFNRITGSRRAIVDRLAGSTRDRNVSRTEWAGREFELVDTGGLFERPETTLEEQILTQCQVAMDDADVICWVVDATAGIVPGDEALASRLRGRADRVLLVVNKVDHPNRSSEAMEFHRLGFSNLVEISAEHGLGVAELLDDLAERLPCVAASVERDEIRVAIVGRPNVGKSSLLNRLVGRERAVVSEVAGTTRDVIDIVLERSEGTFRFVDTAGIRRRGKTPRRADQLAVLHAERAIARAHLCLLVLDASRGITTEDAAIGGKIADAGRGAVLVFNKWDRVQDREQQVAIQTDEVLDRLPHLGFAPRSFVSAKTGRGIQRLLPLVVRVREHQLQRVDTPRLNVFLEDAFRRNPPRARDGKEVRLFYMAQTGVAPPRFVVFANRVRELDPSYRRYLARRLREEFGFEGTPIRVTLRKRRR